MAVLLAAGSLTGPAAATPPGATGRMIVKLSEQPTPLHLAGFVSALGSHYLRGGTRAPYLLLDTRRRKFILPARLRGRVEYVEPEIRMTALGVAEGAPSPRLLQLGRERIGTPAQGSSRANALLSAVPTDPLFPHQWSFQDSGFGIRLPGARQRSLGAGVVVGIVDTGVRRSLSDLAGVDFLAGYDAIKGGSGGTDDNGHGSHVCGTIAQATNNGIGCAGIAPACRILPVKALDASGSGSNFTIGVGIRYAVDHGAQVINLSLGGGPSRTLQDAVQYALGRGVTLCCAAGNNGGARLTYPAAYPGVIAVGATNSSGKRASFSQYGAGLTLVAPGEQILQQTFSRSTGRSGYFYFSGTSMATPHVAGVAALVKALAPQLGPPALLALLQATARDLGPAGYDTGYGAGLLDAAAACERVAGTLPAPTPLPDTPPPLPEPVPPALPVTPDPGVPDAVQARTLVLLNTERAQGGLAPVAINAALTVAASRHAQEMALRGVLSHTGADGSNPGQRLTRAGYAWRTWGEIIDAGQRTPEEVVAAWMASPGHHAIVVSPAYTEVGIGRAGDYWCVDWAAR
jgi:serine protease